MGRFVTRDTVAGLACLGLSAWLYSLTFGLPKSPFVPIGPDFYPRLVLGVTAAVSVALIVTGIAAARRGGGRAAAAPRSNYAGVGLSFAFFWLYVLVLPRLGFRIATFLFVVALGALLERPAAPGPWLRIGLTGLVTAAATHLVFERYLSVLLPRGTWTGF
jgi:hypothetical protein